MSVVRQSLLAAALFIVLALVPIGCRQQEPERVAPEHPTDIATERRSSADPEPALIEELP